MGENLLTNHCGSLHAATPVRFYEIQLQKNNSITNAATARSNLDTVIYTADTILQLQSTMEFHRQTHPPAPLAIPFTVRGTILELQITMEFHRQLIHQHHLQPHLQCENDPTVTNHNGILSTTRARKTIENPIYNAETDPTMIRP